ncbi:DUF4124 domain-containing protein [Dyella halodurans]|uniref:DUF4124 domain-containing protein n=1 Tax=Dyella halodurans TaxID=1920171 RepID=A0ABV9C8H9_9GAMM|nr:DUF4124 domain-containing protein [Dyella halodurans]
MVSTRIRLLLLLFLLPMGAAAQEGIHRCVGADGNPLFTDQPCAALQATPMADAAAAGATTHANPPQEPAIPPPLLCAASVPELRQSVIDAFSRHDPNRLAGLMLWSGYGRGAVVADIRSLSELMQHTLLDVGEASEDAAPAPAQSSDMGSLERSLDPADAATPAAAPSPPPADRQLVVRTAANDGSGVPHDTHFVVVRRSGCLWLRSPG